MREFELSPQELRGWPDNWTATLGGSRHDQLLHAIEGASTIKELVAIRDEATAWEAAVAGHNIEAPPRNAEAEHDAAERNIPPRVAVKKSALRWKGSPSLCSVGRHAQSNPRSREPAGIASVTRAERFGSIRPTCSSRSSDATSEKLP